MSTHRSIISDATFIASFIGSSTHLVTSPIFSASKPDTILPVIVNSLATSMRKSSLNVTEAPMSGINPHRDSIIDSRQSGVENLRSAPRAICRPIERVHIIDNN